MFMHDLSTTEKEASLALIHALAEADETVSAQEEEALQLFSNEAGIDVNGSLSLMSVDDALEALERQKARVSIMLELLMMAHSGQEYHPEENQFIQQVAEKFNFSKARLIRMKNWALRQVSLVKEAEEMRQGVDTL